MSALVPLELARPAALLAAESVPVVPRLAEVFPQGLTRGSSVAVEGSTSLLLDLLAGPSQDGGWCAVVGLPALGVAAAAEAGVALERLVLIPRSSGAQWQAVLSILLDAFDVVAVAPPAAPRERDARQLAARLRRSRTLLVIAGSWPGADRRISVVARRWEGHGCGEGALRRCAVEVEVRGRGALGVPRRVQLLGSEVA